MTKQVWQPAPILPSAPGQGRARGRLVTAAGLGAVVFLLVVPSLLVRPIAPHSRFAWVPFATGGIASLLLSSLRWASVTRNSRRSHDHGNRLLTAATLTGPRTIDLRAIKSVRARIQVGRGTPTHQEFLIITDEHGVRMTLNGRRDGPRVREALSWQSASRRSAVPPRISWLASRVLRPEGPPGWLLFIWGTASIFLFSGTFGCCLGLALYIASG